jgi:hypothetical protein
MKKLCLALLLLAGGPCVAAQPAVSASAVAVPIAPGVDTPEQRQRLYKFSVCMAQSRPRWARQTLARPYLSADQERIAGIALKGTDSCIVGRDDTEVTFRTSGLVGSLAEYFLRAELDKADPARLARALNTISPLNASEDFALCVAAHNPAGARDLALSVPGSEAETGAARSLASDVAPCLRSGEDVSIDLQSLRALMATALYRGVMAVAPNRS